MITVARTSQTMLSKNGENRHPCLAPYPKGNTISFCPLSMMLTVGFSYMAFIMLRYDPSIPTLLSVFIINVCCTFKMLFPHLLIWSCDFFFRFVYTMCYVYWFVNIVPSLHPWDEFHLIMVYDLFNVLFNPDCQYFVRDFRSYFHQRYWL